MLTTREIEIPGYEKVIEGIDTEVNLHCFIAVHNTSLGPALGGTRIYPYHNPQDALNDALRLAKAMTQKSALAQVGLGGGKSVIIADPKKEKTPELLHAFGKVIDLLKGKYIAAEDVGSSMTDMTMIRESTPYVCALPTKVSSGDPSRFTAWGVFRGIQAVAQHLWGSTSLKGKTIAVQGLGHVGGKLADLLFWNGATLIITDVDKHLLESVRTLTHATIVPHDKILSTECDILAPCAMGGILNANTIPHLRCKAVAGGANNQLMREEDGTLLYQRGILYAPDFIINAGGVINAAMEFESEGYNPITSREKVDRIYDTLQLVFKRSDQEKKPTEVVAEELANYNLEHGLSRRAAPIVFNLEF